MAAVRLGLNGALANDDPLVRELKRVVDYPIVCVLVNAGTHGRQMLIHPSSFCKLGEIYVWIDNWRDKSDEQIIAEFETGVAICKLSGRTTYDPGA